MPTTRGEDARRTPPFTARYAFTLAATAGSFLLRWALWPLLGHQYPFLLAYPTIVLCGWYGGLGPAVLATFLAALTASVFLIPPLGSPLILDSAERVGLLLFIPSGIGISFLCEALHRSRRQMEAVARRLKASERALQCRTEELLEADRLKDLHLAGLVHELRNPLSAIQNALHLVELRNDRPELEQPLARIERQVQHLTRLTEDLLDVSQIRQGKVRLSFERVDLAEVLGTTVEDCREALEEAGLALHLELPPGPVWIEGDATRLTQVFSNLLLNAAKFTDAGGAVTVRLVPNGRQVTVSVRDTGIGIASEQLPAVFDAFTQVEESRERSRSGLGLGLALVKGLVELHGGDVTVASEGPGRGTEFTVRLPGAQESGRGE